MRRAPCLESSRRGGAARLAGGGAHRKPQRGSRPGLSRRRGVG